MKKFARRTPISRGMLQKWRLSGYLVLYWAVKNTLNTIFSSRLLVQTIQETNISRDSSLFYVRRSNANIAITQQETNAKIQTASEAIVYNPSM